jgi:hypothetical protein
MNETSRRPFDTDIAHPPTSRYAASCAVAASMTSPTTRVTTPSSRRSPKALQPNGVLILECATRRLLGAQDPGAALQKARLDRPRRADLASVNECRAAGAGPCDSVSGFGDREPPVPSAKAGNHPSQPTTTGALVGAAVRRKTDEDAPRYAARQSSWDQPGLDGHARPLGARA